MAVDAGNTHQTAKRLGILGSNPILEQQTLSAADPLDYYQFRIDGTQRITFRSRMNYTANTGSRANFDLELYRRNDSDGSFTLLQTSLNAGLLGDTLNLNLTPGVYQVKVERKSGQGEYSLVLRNVPDTAGDTFNNALELGRLTLGQQITRQPEILGGRPTPTGTTTAGFTADVDYYRFSLNRKADVNLQLTGLNNGARLTLFRGSEADVLSTVESFPTATANGVALISRALIPGTYVFKVEGLSNRLITTPGYVINLSGTEAPDEGGNQGAPRNLDLGFKTTRIEEFVGNFDERDVYTFTPTITGQLRLRLDATVGSADIALFAGNSPVGNETVTTTEPGSFDLEVQQGTQYTLEINRTTGSPNTGYLLSGSVRPPDRVGNDFATATLLTNPGASTSFPSLSETPQIYSDFIAEAGDETDNDVFKLVLQDPNRVAHYRLRFDLKGLSDDAKLELYKEVRGSATPQLLNTYPGNATRSARSDGTLAEGVYYLRVTPGSIDAASTYQLEMSLRSVVGVPGIVRNVAFNGDANASNLVEVQGTAFFTAFDGESEQPQSLYQSSGSLDSTIRIDSFSSISNLRSAGNALYFLANKGQGEQLWKWQSSTGASVVQDTTAPAVSAITNLFVVGNSLIFQGTVAGSSTAGLFWTNGTEIEQIENAGLNLTSFVAVGNDLYYVADAPGVTGGPVLHRVLGAGNSNNPSPATLASEVVNGGTFGTVNIRDIRNLTSVVNEDRNNNGQEDDGFSLFFLGAQPGQFFYQLRRLDLSGTTPQLTTYSTLGEEAFGSNPPPGTFVRTHQRQGTDTATDDNFYVYFAASALDTSQTPATFIGSELWRVDLRTNTPNLVQDLNLGNNGSNPANLTLASFRGSNQNDLLFFTADNGTTGTEVWAYNGIQVKLVRDVNPSTDPNFERGSNSGSLTVSGTSLYFTADTPLNLQTNEGGRELWEVNLLSPDLFAQDNSAAVRLFDLRETVEQGVPASSDPQQLIDINGQLYFTADNGVDGREVFTNFAGTEDEEQV